MIHKIKLAFFSMVCLMALAMAGCKKNTFDINSPNPNSPSTIDPKYILASSLTTTAVIVAGNPGGGSRSGNDLIECFMGYWATSGDFSPNSQLLTLTLTSDFGSSFWDNTYPVIQNLKNIEAYYGTSTTGNNYVGISKIVKSMLFARLVDMYNNIPYSQASASGTNSFPAYDDAQAVYKSCINQIDSGITLITNAPSTADNPASYDAMFGGTMSKWITFGNTLKLRMLLKFTSLPGGPAYIMSKLTGLTAATFIGANADASINPGYSTATNGNLNPLWYDIGFTNTGGTGPNNSYFRANSYAVNFYKNTNDPRLPLFYTAVNNTVTGRAFGSTNGAEKNTVISAIGGNPNGATQTAGVLKSPTQSSVIISSAESYFMQAEAVQRGILTIPGATAAYLYQMGVAESFRLLGVTSYANAAMFYTGQAGDNVNFSAGNPLKTIIVQKWAAMNCYNPLASWSDWRRTGFPSDLPVPVYPGTTITHIPYRLLYPTTEYSYNTANVNAQGTITQDSKIFWMP